MSKIAIGLQALGAGFQGGDPSAPIMRQREAVERAERKEAINSLLSRMKIAGPERALIETLPVEQAQAYLANTIQQRQAQARAGAAAAQKAAAQRAEMEAMQGYFAPRTEQVAPLGATMQAAQAGATSGADLTALQTRTAAPRLTPELMRQVMLDPRISDAGRKRIMDAYQIQQDAAPQPDWQLVGNSYVDMNNPGAGAQPIPGIPAQAEDPMTQIGKLNADLKAGRITQEQFDLALQNMAPKGLGINVDAAGNMTILENATAGFGKAAQNEVEMRQINAAANLTRLQDTAALLKPEYLQIPDRIGYAWTALQEKFSAGDVTPEAQAELANYSKFRTQAYNNLNTTLKELSGAAVTPQEAERLLEQLPNVGTTIWNGDSPTQFKSKMEESIRMQRMAIARYNLWIQQGSVGNPWDMGSLTDVPAMIDARGDEIATELRARGITDAKVLKEQVRAQLMAELWG